MSEKVNYGILKDYDDNKFIPIGHSKLVYDDDGNSVEDRLIALEDEMDDIQAQDGFKNVKVGEAIVVADQAEDTLELAGNKGITLTADTANDKVTISHSNQVTAKTSYSQNSDANASGDSFTVTEVKYDTEGHITGKQEKTITLPSDVSGNAATATRLETPVNITIVDDKGNKGNTTSLIGNRDITLDLPDTISANIEGKDGEYFFIDKEDKVVAKISESGIEATNVTSSKTSLNDLKDAFDEFANDVITEVVAGAGLTGGGSNGSVTLNVATDRGLSVQNDKVGHSTTGSTDVTQTAGKAVTKLDIDAYGHVTGTGVSDVINSITVSGSGNAITAASNTNGAVTLTKGVTFKTQQTAVKDPTASGNATAFIDSISQDANGVITVTKKNITTSDLGGINTVTATGTAPLTLKAEKTGTNVAITGSIASAGTDLGTVKSGGDVTINSGVITVNDDSHKHKVANISDLTATAAELNIMDGVTASTAEINKLDGLTATTAELNYVDGVTSNIQTQLNSKQPNLTGAATTIANSNLAASRVVVSNTSGKIAASDITITELNQLDGVTGNIQNQLKQKYYDVESGSTEGSIKLISEAGNEEVTVNGLGHTGDGKYYFVDDKDNVNTFIDGTGIHSTEFRIPEGAIDGGDITLSGLYADTEAVQNQLDNTKWALSTSVGGPAVSANKLNTNAGSSTNPVYFENGIPKATGGSLAKNITGNAATANKVNQALTVGTKTFDGSTAVTITASDLGLAQAMKFLGTSATAITDGATTNPITIGSTSTTVASGNVVLYGTKEFVWTGSKWEELGNEGSYKVKQTAVASPSTDGNDSAFIDTIQQDANGNITATKKNVQITVDATATDDDVVVLTATDGTNAVTYDAKHAQKGPSSGYTSGNTTTSISGSGGSGTIKIPQLTVDKYGHVTAAADESITITMPSSVTGNAGTADKWKTARNISIADSSKTNTGTAVSVDGSENETLLLPATIKATLTGNADTATKLKTARKINGTDFDGSADITTAKWGTARNFSITDGAGHTGNITSVNGSDNVSLDLPDTIVANIESPEEEYLFIDKANNVVVKISKDGIDTTDVKTPKTSLNKLKEAFDTIYTTPVSTTKAGVAPVADAALGTIDNQTNDWVLTKNDNGTVDWYKLPANAFKDTTYEVANTSSAGLAQQLSGKTAEYYRGDGAWAVPPDTKYTAGDGLTLTGTKFEITTADASEIINKLGEGTSEAKLDDYLVAQYAGGGETTTTYHRRKVSSVVNATVVKNALGTGTGTTKYLREDGTWQTPVDTKVTQTAKSDDASYPILGATVTSSGSASTAVYNTGICFNPSKKTLTASSFIANSSLLPDASGGANIGTTELPWGTAYAKNFSILDGTNTVVYGKINPTTVGTASVVGVGRLTLGNNTVSGTAGNAKGQILMYGENTGYTVINQNNNTTSAVTITLPDNTGTLATIGNIGAGTGMNKVTDGDAITLNVNAGTGLTANADNITLNTATDSALGGVKLSDSTTSTNSTSNGIAATPKAVKSVQDNVNTVSTATNNRIHSILPGTKNGSIKYAKYTGSNNAEVWTDNVFVQGIGDSGDGNFYFVDNANKSNTYNTNDGMHSVDFTIDGTCTLKGLHSSFTTVESDYISGIKTSTSGGLTLTATKGTDHSITLTGSSVQNTAGSTDTSSKIFLIGATTQAANPQTYSHNTAYVGTDGHLYSDSKQVVNLSGTQALTNKTYNGYTLAAACTKGVTDSSSASALSTGTNLVTERDVYYGLASINNARQTSEVSIYAPVGGGTKNYLLKSNGTTTAPIWADPSEIKVGSATAADSATKASQDASGNVITSTYATKVEDAAKLPLAGGTMTGHIYLSGSVANSSTSNTSQLIFGTPETEHVAISSNDNAIIINRASDDTERQIELQLDIPSIIPSGMVIGQNNTVENSGITIEGNLVPPGLTIGMRNIVGDRGSLVHGYGNETSGTYIDPYLETTESSIRNFISGSNNKISGYDNQVLGNSHNIINSTNVFTAGANNEIRNAYHAIALGRGLLIENDDVAAEDIVYNRTVIGNYNANDPDAVFIVANGSGVDSNRKNAFTIKNNGSAVLAEALTIGSTAIDSNNFLTIGNNAFVVKKDGSATLPGTMSIGCLNCTQISSDYIIPAADNRFDIFTNTSKTGTATLYVDNKKVPTMSTQTITIPADTDLKTEFSVTCTGVTSSNTVIVSPAPSSLSDYSNCGIYCSGQGTNQLKFLGEGTPTIPITVQVIILN